MSGGEEATVASRSGQEVLILDAIGVCHSAGLVTSTRSVPAVLVLDQSGCSRCSRIKRSHEPQLHSVLFVGCFQACGGETAEDCLSLCLSSSSAVCFSILFFTFCLSSWSPSLIFQTDVFLRRIFHHTECVRSGLCRCCSALRLALGVSDSC